MKVLMVVAKEGFRDEEYQIPYDYFKSKNLIVDVASTEKGQCIGKLGLVIDADLSFDNVNVQEYFAVVVVGGPGSQKLVGNEQLEAILKAAVNENIVVAAICYAPMILSEAGLLKGKKATVWNNDKMQSPILKDRGVIFIDKPVVVDGLFVTGNGPGAAKAFAEQVVKLLECDDCWMKK